MQPRDVKAFCFSLYFAIEIANINAKNHRSRSPATSKPAWGASFDAAGLREPRFVGFGENWKLQTKRGRQHEVSGSAHVCGAFKTKRQNDAEPPR